MDTAVKVPLVGVQGYQTCPLSKPGVGQNIAWHAVPQAWYFSAILLKSGKVKFHPKKTMLRVETTSDALRYT